MEHKQVARL